MLMSHCGSGAGTCRDTCSQPQMGLQKRSDKAASSPRLGQGGGGGRMTLEPVVDGCWQEGWGLPGAGGVNPSLGNVGADSPRKERALTEILH